MKNVLPFVCPHSWPQAQSWIAALQAAMPKEQVVLLDELDIAEREACEVAIVANPDPNDLKLLPNLKWVHSVWAGVERLMADLQSNHQLKVVRLVDPQLAATMAEAVLAWTLYLHRDMPLYAKQQREKHWLEHEYIPAEEKMVSILGLGELGLAAASKLSGAGFKVCGWSRTAKSIPDIQCYHGDNGLLDMLAKTDFLVCLLPLTPQTKNLINKNVFSALKKHASFINFGRGPIVDDHALQQSLESGCLAHAVLDVFNQEPLTQDSWHWTHQNITVLPHISAPTNRKTASAIVAHNIDEYRVNGTIPKFVDRVTGY
ncbi:2-hydroxyacid dehydrogenase [Acinetobacter sp. MB5]|uniref:2-hydroxyacid dehydrogenase n=1 Tax=Acinetobacter sp. MB5 TaxID=2069438 RepID=UPI000DCFB6AA|nr:glyoxylate/hydroxypyruvate reductase A [Acinetobacter sp. MB5]